MPLTSSPNRVSGLSDPYWVKEEDSGQKMLMMRPVLFHPHTSTHTRDMASEKDIRGKGAGQAGTLLTDVRMACTSPSTILITSYLVTNAISISIYMVEGKIEEERERE